MEKYTVKTPLLTELFGGIYSEVIAKHPLCLFTCEHESDLFLGDITDISGTSWASNSPMRRSLTNGSSITAMASTPDFSLIACAVCHEEVSTIILLAAPIDTTIVDISQYSLKPIVESLDFTVRSMSFKDRVLVFSTDEGRIEIFDVFSKKRTRLFQETLYGGCKNVAAHPRESRIAASFCDGHVLILDFAGRVLEKCSGFSRKTTDESREKFTVNWHPSGTWLAIGSLVIRVTESPLKAFIFPADALTFGKWSQDGSFLASISDLGKSVFIFEFQMGICT